MANEDHGYGLDSTAIHLKLLELCQAYTADLERQIDNYRAFRRSVRLAVGALDGLNLRQREALVQMVLNPHASLTIADHRGKNGVAYSTARTDLTQLADLGFLVQRPVGQEYEFVPGKQLTKIVSSLTREENE